MAHRIEIELTSDTGQGTWTWRAAGAKQPRGAVPAELVPAGTTAGTVLRAEVESTIDGLTVTALLPPKGHTDGRSAERIELVGSAKVGPDVNVVYAPKGAGGRDRDRGRGGRDRGDGDGDRDRPRQRARGERDGGPRGGRDGARGGERTGGRTERPGTGGRTERPGTGGRSERPGTGSGDRHGGRPGTRSGPRRPAASTVHRNAALATLPPEQLPIAEQLIRGGIPAVRHAIEEQNTRARADGRPEVTPEPLLALAEQLLPIVNLAVWKDRAAAAKVAGRDVPLRELRAVVTSAQTVSLDDEGRELAAGLKTSLDERVTALRTAWVDRITRALDEGRVVDALATSARAPEHGTRLSAELAVRLAEAAGLAMAPDADPVTWQAVLAAVLDSPVCRTVRPAGLPMAADEAVQAAARKASGQVPELARLLGIPIPPPPGPRRPVTTRAGGRRSA